MQLHEVQQLKLKQSLLLVKVNHLAIKDPKNRGKQATSSYPIQSYLKVKKEGNKKEHCYQSLVSKWNIIKHQLT